MTPKITIEKSKGRHIETPITSERSKILMGIRYVNKQYFTQEEVEKCAQLDM